MVDLDGFYMEYLPDIIREEIFQLLPQPLALIIGEAVSFDWKRKLPYHVCKTLKFPLFKSKNDRYLHDYDNSDDDQECKYLSIIKSILNRFHKHVTKICISYDRNITSKRSYCSDHECHCIDQVLNMIFRHNFMNLLELDMSNYRNYCVCDPIVKKFDLPTSTFVAHLNILRLPQFSRSFLTRCQFTRSQWLLVSRNLIALEICIDSEWSKFVLPFQDFRHLKHLKVKLIDNFVAADNQNCWFDNSWHQVEDVELDLVYNFEKSYNLLSFCKGFLAFALNLKKLKFKHKQYKLNLQWNSALHDVCALNSKRIEHLYLGGNGIVNQFNTPLCLFSNLKTISLIHVHFENEAVLSDIASSCRLIEILNLSSISLKNYKENNSIIDLRCISILMNLRVLRLRAHPIQKFTLPELNWPLKLRRIRIVGNKLSSNQLRSIADCCGAHLKTFNFDYHDRHNFDDLSAYQQFIASIFNCQDVTYFLTKTTTNLKGLCIMFGVYRFKFRVFSFDIDQELAVCIGQVATGLHYFIASKSDISFDDLLTLLENRRQSVEGLATNVMPLSIKFNYVVDFLNTGGNNITNQMFLRDLASKSLVTLPPHWTESS